MDTVLEGMRCRRDAVLNRCGIRWDAASYGIRW